MFDYSQLEALLAIEREGSIDGAARALSVSASAISQRIKVLEERVGAITVNRQKPAKTTVFGKILCRHAEQVILLENELIEGNDKYFSGMDRESNVIVVAMDQVSISTWFPEVIKVESARNPSILYQVKIVENGKAIDMLMEGTVLAAVSNKKKPIQGYRSLSLGKQTFAAVMTPAYARSHFPKGVNAETIQNCATIRRNCNDVLYREWLSDAFGFEFEIQSHIIPSANALLTATLHGMAWTMLPYEVAQPYLNSGKLVELVTDCRTYRPIYWHYSRAISTTLKPLNDTVQKIAYKLLMQETEDGSHIPLLVKKKDD